MQLWLSIPAFKQQAKPSTWIYRVALNTALTKQRKDKKHRHRRASIDLDSLVNQDAVQDNPEAIEQLYQCIRQLAKIDRSLILMHLDGLNHGDIAQVLGISENNAGVRIHRTKQRLRDLMKGVIHDL